jgi:large subunit ribosomal protein L13
VKTSWISENDIKRKWHLVDAKGKGLGRTATVVASLLIGKGKVNRVPNMDCGDYVVVINAADFDFSKKKLKTKIYSSHSGYAGGFKQRTLEQEMARNPENVFRTAVRNMLPNTKLRSSMMARLMVFSGEKHSHEAQKPEPIEITSK